MTWEELKEATKCQHATRTPVRYVKSNNTVGVCLQCQTCGHKSNDVPQDGYRVNDLPTLDPTLEERWRSWCANLRDQTNTEQNAQLQAAQEAEAIARWQCLNAYYQTPHWQAVRRKVIQRDGFTCQLCFRRVTEADAHAHHLSYDTYNLIGQSLPAECVTLCRSCHARIEAAKHPGMEWGEWVHN